MNCSGYDDVFWGPYILACPPFAKEVTRYLFSPFKNLVNHTADRKTRKFKSPVTLSLMVTLANTAGSARI